jgi:hypothetical protein
MAGEDRVDRIAALAAWRLAGCAIYHGVAFPCGYGVYEDMRYPLVWFATQEDVDDALRLIAAMRRDPVDRAPAA